LHWISSLLKLMKGMKVLHPLLKSKKERIL